jgi:phosphate transport system substrate-binding protein
MHRTPVKSRVIRGLAAMAVASGVLVVGSGNAQAAKAGQDCKLKDAYAIEKVGTSYIRCQIVPGTSLHAKDKNKKAKFKWVTMPTASGAIQWQLAQAKNETIRIDGSSTVAPLGAVGAKYFEQASRSVNKKDGVKVVVGISGTGGGFQKFCAGETDISNASRAISASERAACARTGVEFVEVPVANDGLALVINKQNTWAKCLTTDEIRRIWINNSTVNSWADVRAGFPAEPIRLFGAGTDSGTFDSFGDFAVGGVRNIRRTGVQTSEDDNVTVRGVMGSRGGLGYFGLSYAIENEKNLTTVQIDKGQGCVTPTIKTVQDNSYYMSRPLFMYPKKASLQTKPAVGAFMSFMISNVKQISEDALFVPLTNRQIEAQRRAIAEIARLPKLKK